MKYTIANNTSILYTLKEILRAIIENLMAEMSFAIHSVFPVPTDVINLCGKNRIRKSRHYGGQEI